MSHSSELSGREEIRTIGVMVMGMQGGVRESHVTIK